MIKKLTGRELYKAIGEPKTIVAPMVDQSELAWRILSRRYGADLCYTPMYHARLFGESAAYRSDHFGPADGSPEIDRPLIVQFCANNEEELLSAAKHVVGRCDAVDLNLGCPQGIARKGHYGSFLMEDWDLIYRLINKLHTELDVPVTAKIRIYEDREKTLAYAKHVLSAGAQFLTVHGRTRDMKGQKTGLADWSVIRYLRDNLPPDTVMFCNGNILYPDDVDRCLEETETDAVMSAEGNLFNPGVFNINKPAVDDQFPRCDKLLREYFEIVKSVPGNASKNVMKTHFFKILNSFLYKNPDMRPMIGAVRKNQMDEFENIVQTVEERVKAIYESGEVDDVVVEGELEQWGGRYREIPYWRCQPYFRSVDGITSRERETKKRISSEAEEPANSNERGEAQGSKRVKVDNDQAVENPSASASTNSSQQSSQPVAV